MRVKQKCYVGTLGKPLHAIAFSERRASFQPCLLPPCTDKTAGAPTAASGHDFGDESRLLTGGRRKMGKSLLPDDHGASTWPAMYHRPPESFYAKKEINFYLVPTMFLVFLFCCR